MPRLGFNFFGELMNFDSLLSQWNNNFHDSDEADGKMYGNHDVHSSDKVDGHVRIDDDDAGLPLAEWLWVKTAECRKKVLDTSFIQVILGTFFAQGPLHAGKVMAPLP